MVDSPPLTIAEAWSMGACRRRQAVGDVGAHRVDFVFRELHLGALDGDSDEPADLYDRRFQGPAALGRRVAVSLDRQVFFGEDSVPEMVLIGLGLPRLDFLQEFRHVRKHLQGHDDLIEIVEKTRGQQGLLVDVRPPHPGA
ncbi:MAG: hypothetical protein QF450_09410 [Rhodospirillales bacterium]|jgi:hypothetical protein|nr:hypothetical protein [Rhodospirillales bacterium]